MQTEMNTNTSVKTRPQKNGPYKKFFKRVIDIICSLLLSIVLSPVLIITAILVRTKLGSPIIFKQKRPGLNEKIFTLYKFRTMTNERDKNGNLMPDEVRLTSFGKILRSTSLDELPELFNIFLGDMSIVGPRPQLIKDMVFMLPEQRLRQTVTPGLTGWAQVNGRNGITWEEKLELDLEYIKNITFFGDVKIVLITVIKVFNREGISANDMDTAEDFGDFLLREQKISEDEYYAAIEKSRKLGI
ncbi:MAG: sugar transferase [Desulfitobacteriaceae bacterium]